MILVINGERAAYTAPAFNQTRTRKEWIRDVIAKYK
jgi:hypothetical protein